MCTQSWLSTLQEGVDREEFGTIDNDDDGEDCELSSNTISVGRYLSIAAVCYALAAIICLAHCLLCLILLLRYPVASYRYANCFI
ncbi:hypothetical protein Dimus_035334, partial [Dionaea muscipula]